MTTTAKVATGIALIVALVAIPLLIWVEAKTQGLDDILNPEHWGAC